MLGSDVKPMEWGSPSADTLAPGLDKAWSIFYHWNSFNKRDSSATHIRELYPNLFRILVAARAEEYSIPFPKSYQRVAKEGMFIRNHDFDEMVELV